MKKTYLLALVVAAMLGVGASGALAAAKVQICHLPPDNPANFHTITVSDKALPAHLAHGDFPGSCSAYAEKLCDDGNACTIDAMDPKTEKCLTTHPPVNCDDGNLCTIDSCDAAIGCMNEVKNCGDGLNCTVDACNPETGECTNVPIACEAGKECQEGQGLDYECRSPDDVDCVSSYGEFSACSASCGGGYQTAQLTITTPTSGNGLDCPAAEVTQTCNTDACVVPDVACVWTYTTSCVGACETYATVTITTEASGNGTPCPTSLVGTQLPGPLPGRCIRC